MYVYDTSSLRNTAKSLNDRDPKKMVGAVNTNALNKVVKMDVPK